MTKQNRYFINIPLEIPINFIKYDTYWLKEMLN